MIALSRFDLVSLRLYVAVVEAGSLTAGAERFGISLAAASKRIAELERHCGVELLSRGKRGVAPTPAGQTLHRHAIELVGGLERMAVALDDYAGGISGHVRLWANTSAVNGFLPPLLAGFAAEQPGIRLDLEEALSDDVVQAVGRGVAELGVFAENTRARELHTVVCDTDELVLLLPRGHPLSRRRRIAFADALALDFVALGGDTSLVRLLGAQAQATGRPLKVRVRLRSFDAICRMVAEGLGAAVLPRAAAAAHAASMRLRMVGLDEPWAERRLLLGTRDPARLSAPARALAARIEARGGGRTPTSGPSRPPAPRLE